MRRINHRSTGVKPAGAGGGDGGCALTDQSSLHRHEAGGGGGEDWGSLAAYSSVIAPRGQAAWWPGKAEPA